MMSTHNCVAPAGDACFLEIIGIDPDAPATDRTRWFSLDNPMTQTRLSERAQPLCCVISTDSLDEIVNTSLTHPNPDQLREMLSALRVDHLANVRTGATRISYELDSPNGTVVLD